jgi:hypothetical protein
VTGEADMTTNMRPTVQLIVTSDCSTFLLQILLHREQAQHLLTANFATLVIYAHDHKDRNVRQCLEAPITRPLDLINI